MIRRCNHCKFYKNKHCNKKLIYRSPHERPCNKFKPKEEDEDE